MRQINFLCILVVLCCLSSSVASVTNAGLNSEEYLLALKNDKVFALKYYPEDDSMQQIKNLIWIHNDQQSIIFEVPVNKQNEVTEHQTSNLTQTLPILSSLLKSKGYLKPFNPFNTQSTHFLKGYRYTKPAYHDSSVYQTYEEIQAFIKAVIQLNNLTSLNLRMEDTFNFRLEISNGSPTASDFKVTGLDLRYLFATVGKELLPEWINQKVGQNVIGYEQYIKNSKASVLQRRLYGKGLHQWVNHTVTLDDITDIELQSLGSSCFFQFTDILPESTYIDADQRREQTTNYQTINIQKPAFASKQYFYRYRAPWSSLKETGVRKYTYHQPVHFRYPSPSLLNYTRVYLHPIDEVRIVCEVKENGAENSSKQVVFRVEENLLFERGTASIPNADISKAKIVSITTLVVCLVAALVIIRQLK